MIVDGNVVINSVDKAFNLSKVFNKLLENAMNIWEKLVDKFTEEIEQLNPKINS